MENVVVDQGQALASVTPAQEPDILVKVAQVPPAQAAMTDENAIFDFKEIEKITDPVAKDIATKAYKSMQGNYTKKTQEIAVQRKELEQKFEEMKNWSPERIQRELLSNPQFLAAAEQVSGVKNPPNSGLTDDQFSALTENEKKELASLKSQVNELKQSNIQNVIRAEISNRDAQLAQKFADYNPVEIHKAFESLANMGAADVREYIYKATQHDVHVKAAYELGKQEGRGITQDKIGAISTNGTTTVSNDGVPTKIKGESDQAFFVRLASYRLTQHRKK